MLSRRAVCLSLFFAGGASCGGAADGPTGRAPVQQRADLTARLVEAGAPQGAAWVQVNDGSFVVSTGERVRLQAGARNLDPSGDPDADPALVAALNEARASAVRTEPLVVLTAPDSSLHQLVRVLASAREAGFERHTFFVEDGDGAIRKGRRR